MLSSYVLCTYSLISFIKGRPMGLVPSFSILSTRKPRAREVKAQLINYRTALQTQGLDSKVHKRNPFYACCPLTRAEHCELPEGKSPEMMKGVLWGSAQGCKVGLPGKTGSVPLGKRHNASLCPTVNPSFLTAYSGEALCSVLGLQR